MKSLPRAVFAACLLTGALGNAGAVSLPVTNAGFEAPILPDGGETPFSTGGTTSIPGWLITGFLGGGGAVANPLPGLTAFPGGVPEGQNFGYAQAATISQLLSAPLAVGQYTLSMYLGNPADRSDDSDPARFELFVPSTNRVVLSSGNISFAAIPNGSFARFTATGVVSAADVDLGHPLQLRVLTGLPIGVVGPYFAFDDVQLDLSPVPEPASWALLSGGVLALCMHRMRRRAAAARLE